MNTVLYYSNTGECKRIAEYFANKAGYELTDITTVTNFKCEFAVLVFPVYCQNIPTAVCEFLSKLQTKYLLVIACYGKMSCGNVIEEIQRKYKHTIIGAAYVPTKHAYINEPQFSGFEKLNPLIEKLNAPAEITLPRFKKNPFANFAPAWRSRIGVKIIKNNACDNCGTCTKICNQKAIKNGKTNNLCLRCLRCVNICPKKALSIKLSSVMSSYLKKNKKTNIEIFI